ncbi:MAG: hypothetical protein ABS54_07725 [Hyphomicrobium sp. SCN 65-11]|nr:MAG: hypothetical protein ABS54_07725 [Hyphomicrobium sp. SCN 65-11]
MDEPRERRKRQAYRGRLRRPLPTVQSTRFPGRLGAPLLRLDAELASEIFAEWLDRISELCEQLDIDQSKSGWARDLALTLALRHEELIVGDRVKYSELFRKFGIDSSDANADFRLALLLAEKHVPGLGLKQRLPAAVSDTDAVGAAMLIIAIRAVRRRLEVQELKRRLEVEARAGRGARSTPLTSTRAIARVLLGAQARDEPALQSIMGVEAARLITTFLTSTGNDARSAGRTVAARDKALRKYIDAILTDEHAPSPPERE